MYKFGYDLTMYSVVLPYTNNIYIGQECSLDTIQNRSDYTLNHNNSERKTIFHDNNRDYIRGLDSLQPMDLISLSASHSLCNVEQAHVFVVIATNFILSTS